jgi:hypothetical protein
MRKFLLCGSIWLKNFSAAASLFKTFCHFSPRHNTALKSLQLYGEDLETIVLSDNQFAVLKGSSSAPLTVIMRSGRIASRDASHSNTPLESAEPSES